MSKLFDYQSAEARLALADAVKAALAETYEKLHEAQLRELTRLTEHLTKAPRSTWRVAALTGSNTPDVAVEFPAQVAYIDNASTAAVQVRAPGDIAPSPPIPAGGQGVWLMPGATQLTVSGTGTGQVRIRFLNDAAARLLWQAPPSSVTAGGATQVALTGSLAPLTAAAPKLIGTVPYTSFTASGSIYPSFRSVLSRNARRRTFYLYNALNESLASAGYIPQDSALAPAGVSVTHSEAASVTPVASQIVIDTSEQLPLLAAHVDSMAMYLGMGATLPTSGAVYLYVTEVL